MILIESHLLQLYGTFARHRSYDRKSVEASELFAETPRASQKCKNRVDLSVILYSDQRGEFKESESDDVVVDEDHQHTDRALDDSHRVRLAKKL